MLGRKLFNLFTKNSKYKGELIIHPEFIDTYNKNFNIKNERIKISPLHEFNKHEININDTEENLNTPYIKLDKNGVPIIKKNYYECLGVSSTASPKEIKINFLKIAKKFHPDKNPLTLDFFTHSCNAYETLMDQQKRAAYDDDLLNNSEGVYYIKIWKFKINVIFVSAFALVFFLSYYARNYYKSLKMFYICPLGEEKFEVDKLKFSSDNLKMLKFIETTKEEMFSQGNKKIAEDDEYEYFVENTDR